MIQATFIVFGLTHFVSAIFDKWNVWLWIEKQGSKTRSKFIFDLSFCRFCLLFHLSCIITAGMSFFSPFSWPWLIVPFLVSGITHKINKDGL